MNIKKADIEQSINNILNKDTDEKLKLSIELLLASRAYGIPLDDLARVVDYKSYDWYSTFRIWNRVIQRHRK
jgi:hypothetical protein